MAAAQKAQQLIDDNAVVVFSKSYCPYCRSTKSTLDSLGAKYFAIELDQEGKLVFGARRPSPPVVLAPVVLSYPGAFFWPDIH